MHISFIGNVRQFIYVLGEVVNYKHGVKGLILVKQQCRVLMAAVGEQTEGVRV